MVEAVQEELEKTSEQMNEKAEKFQKFLENNEIHVFNVEMANDEFKSVVFRSRIEVNGQMLPMGIIIDESIFTLIRAQIFSGIRVEQQEKLVEFVNQINADFKLFKYYITAENNLYLDICIPFVNETFDSNMIHLMLDMIVKHLKDTYPKIMQKIWAEE